MKILIIGSKGFIGTHCLNYFRQSGSEAWGCDVVVDYTDQQYVQVDATNANYLKVFEGRDFDVCVNCSGAASVPDSLRRPLRDFELNTYNVFRMLNAIRETTPGCKFINLSSAAVYGNPDSLPIVETQNLQPISPYGQHKLQAEAICREFRDHFDVATCSLRIFSAFGDGLRKQLFWDLYQKGRSGNKVTLWGTGMESRDFIHVDDIIQIIDLVIKKGSFSGEAINVANGKEILIKDIVRTFYGCFPEEIDYEFGGQGRKGDPNNWVADISLIKQLGYRQEVSLKDGLKKYYEWAQEE
ncbi:NAD-dependent epimerase/dehydratase family protein [Neolewinella agarilytica]|uniref:dTDP-glucose 4,6-dehydratase/UDP-glucose 4-epimerase n=1 Tax=Neolewinella agarilytica TaxID=478744 RepID=A0A1H9E0H6_9BACT|nr:SDR family oxidoreductase [Neolewinella agarilytica]SEQ18438.1 dTDP-glucose 4,6-dehydratase/UDP-glucose 4-epimerase [Neolewinella agarilytica]